MGTKTKKGSAQAKARKERRKRNKRKKERRRAIAGSSFDAIGRKHRQQVQQLVPAAWAGENALDVAVFDDAVFAGLSEPEKSEVAAVRAAFEFLDQDRVADAEVAVAEIGRKSPLSEWRMLVRGLQHWTDNDLAAATKAWSRLDSQRRPARIAAALKLAHRDDLGSWKAPSSANLKTQNSSAATTERTTEAEQPLIDTALLRAARIVRRTRIDRSAIKIVSTAVNQKVDLEGLNPGATLSPELIDSLASFANNFRSSERALVRAVEQAALDSALCQNYIDIFEKAAGVFRGPVHDPKNLLLSFFFFASIEGSDDLASDYLEKYLASLETNRQLTAPLRGALLSAGYLRFAKFEIAEQTASMNPFAFFDFGPPDPVSARKKIRKLLRASIDAFPANGGAHVLYASWLTGLLDDRNLSKKEKEQFDTELFTVMQRWTKSLPDEVEPHLFLVSKFLDDEQVTEAEPHVQWLVNSRQDSPQIRALPWKLRLLEATKLCRRKANLSSVPEVLQQVATQWPDWLSARWLPYFTAAWMLRSGDQAAYQEKRDAICQAENVPRDSVADACMMLGAAQRMRVPSADMKPLRVPIDAALKSLPGVEFEELLEAGSFFWDMHQAEFSYPAFRMHGGKFGREILKRIKAKPKLIRQHIESSRFRKTLLWISECRFWSDGYELKFPDALAKFVCKDAYVTAAYVNGTIQMRWVSKEDGLEATANFLRSAVAKESDAFYRQWFEGLAEKAEEKVAESKRQLGLGGFGRFAEAFGEIFGGGEDPRCDCEKCRAQRGE